MGALYGALEGHTHPSLRMTFLKRVADKDGTALMQQATPYVSASGHDFSGKDRIFPYNHGLAGHAMISGLIWHSKNAHELGDETIQKALARNMKAVGDDRDPKAVPVSYLAVPILGPNGSSDLVLYADSMETIDPRQIRVLIGYLKGVSKTIDDLQKNQIHNFQSVKEEPRHKGDHNRKIILIQSSHEDR